MIYLIIYLIGIVLAYIGIRIEAGKAKEWDDVLIRLVFSLFSYLMLIILILISNKIPKPPKWL